MTGEELFANVCQGCHMPDGGGRDRCRQLPIAGQPTGISRRADTPSISCSMAGAACPRSATMMNDGQVAAVVNYLRTHFGNNYQDAVSPKDVKDVRR